MWLEGNGVSGGPLSTANLLTLELIKQKIFVEHFISQHELFVWTQIRASHAKNAQRMILTLPLQY